MNSSNVWRRRGSRLLAIIVSLLCIGVVLAGSTVDLIAASAAHTLQAQWKQASVDLTALGLADTTDGIHLGLPFNGNVSPIQEMGTVDIVFGSVYQHDPPGVYNTAYQPFQRDFNATHTLAWWQSQHPDWIAYQCDRVTPAYQFGDANMPLDIDNPGVIDYMMRETIMPAIQAGYPSIAFDNVSLVNAAGRCGIWQRGANGTWSWHQQYDGQRYDPAYRATVLRWAKDMRRRIDTFVRQQNLAPVTIAMNLNEDYAHPADLLALAPYFDIDFNEAGFTTWGQAPVTDQHWLTLVAAVQTLDAQGKAVILNGEEQVPSATITTAQIQWMLASYLLAKGQHTYTYISGWRDGNQQDYGNLNLRPEYSAPIGAPVGPMHAAQGIYLRTFTNGLVLVNPSATHTFTAQLPAQSYQDLYGQGYQGQVTLPPASGLILLNGN